MDEGDVQLCVFVQQFGLKHHRILANFTFTFWIFLRCWAFLFWDTMIFLLSCCVFHFFFEFLTPRPRNEQLASGKLAASIRSSPRPFAKIFRSAKAAGPALPGVVIVVIGWCDETGPVLKKFKWPWNDTWWFFGARHDSQIFQGILHFAMSRLSLSGRATGAVPWVEHRMSGDHAPSRATL